jgi:transcriptional regulator GlxA family with amidase domain
MGTVQQAKLLVELYENEKHAFGEVAQRVGISAREVARRYRASKALQQMDVLGYCSVEASEHPDIATAKA